MSMPSRLARFLGPVFWLFLFYALIFLALPQKAHGQDTSKPSLTSISLQLQTSLDASVKLKEALIVQRQVRADLEQAYASLKAQLQTSSEDLRSQIEALQSQLDASTSYSSSLEAEMVTLTASLESSRKASEGLSQAFQNYKAQATKDVFWWKAGAIGAGALALLLGIALAIK